MNKQQKITMILAIMGLVLSLISCCTVFLKTYAVTQVSESQSNNNPVSKTQDAIIVTNKGGTSNDQSIKHIESNDDPLLTVIEETIKDSFTEVKEMTIETTVKEKDNLVVSINSPELNNQYHNKYWELFRELKRIVREQFYSDCQITLQVPNSDGTVLEIQ